MVLQITKFVFPDVAIKEPDLSFLDTAKRFPIWALPSRIAFTSVPSKAIPAS